MSSTAFWSEAEKCQVPGRDSGYPTVPPTDPDLKIALIRFLGSDYSDAKQTTLRLAHNFAALQTILDIMNYPGFRKRKTCSYFLKLFPPNATFVTPATQPVPPGFLRKLEYNFERFVVALHTIVPVITPQLQTERLVLLLKRFVPIISAPAPQHLHKAA